MTAPKDTLDRTDRDILALLQKDARISNKELAAAVHLAPSSCHTRVRRLEEAGVLKGAHADVDPGALGVGLRTIVMVRMADHAEKKTALLQDFLLRLPEVVDLFLIAGQDDLLLHVAVRDTDHLRALVMDTIGARPEVADIHTSLIYEHVRKPGFPDLSSL
ncbi:MAG: Lrp/AsnC family transcriptional regulator [Planctomycetota bacterium]